jgi:hypothetical protein
MTLEEWLRSNPHGRYELSLYELAPGHVGIRIGQMDYSKTLEYQVIGNEITLKPTKSPIAK